MKSSHLATFNIKQSFCFQSIPCTYAVHDVNFLQCESPTAGSVSTAQNHNRPSHIDSAIVKSKKVYNEILLQCMASVFFVDSVASTG